MVKQHRILIVLPMFVVVLAILIAGSQSLVAGDIEASLENELLWTYAVQGFQKYIRSAAISSNGEYIVAGSDDGVYFFGYDENVPIWRYVTSISSVAMSANGEYIAIADDRGICFFTYEDNIPIWRYTASISSVAISSDGEYIAAGGDDGAYLFKREDNVPIWRFAINRFSSVKISPKGEYIAAKASDGIYLFRHDNMPIWRYEIPLEDIDYLGVEAPFSDGRFVATMRYPRAWFWPPEKLPSREGVDIVIYFDNDDNVPLWTYETEQYIAGPTLPSDGSYVAIGDGSKINLFECDDNVPIWTYIAGNFIRSVAISSNGSYIVAGGDDKKVSLLKPGENVPLWTYSTIDPDPLSGRIKSAAISSDGEYLVAAEGLYHLSEVPHVYFFDVDDNVPLWIYNMPNNIDPHLVTISSDRGYVVVLGRDVGKGVVDGGIMYLFGKAPPSAWQLIETWTGAIKAPVAPPQAATTWPSALLLVIIVLGIGGVTLIIIKKRFAEVRKKTKRILT